MEVGTNINSKIRKLNNLLFFDKENIADLRKDFENKIKAQIKNINNIDNDRKKDNNQEDNHESVNHLNENFQWEIKNKNTKILILPNSKYNFISDNLAKAYASLQSSKNYKNIKRIFLLAHPFRGKVNKIHLSCYDYYETIFNNRFEIDKEVYEDLKDDPQNVIKQHINHFQINNYNVTSFEESNNNNKVSIIEKINSVSESDEDYEFAFDLHLHFLSILFEQHEIKIVPIWFKTSLKEGEKNKFVNYLNNFLNKYLANEENILICSSNLTYFGRNYNYFGNEKDFKARTFYRNKANEGKIIMHIENIDEEAIHYFKNFDEKNFMKIKNLNFCKDLFLLIMKISQTYKYDVTYTDHLCLKFDNIDPNEYELNFCTLANFFATLS